MVKVSGTIYAEALELNQNGDQAATIENSVTKAEEETVIKAGLTKDGIKALQILGLPITKQQYFKYKEKFREPYEAPMNNAILDYKYALMGNTGVTETTNENETPISYTAASLQILTDELKALEQLLPGLLERSREDDIDINNMIGKIKAFTNNKGAAIGNQWLPSQGEIIESYSPVDGISKQPMIFIKVDLPEPEGPINATYSPLSIVILMDFSA